MIEDLELDSWREQWSGFAEPSADLQRQVRERIDRHHWRFALDNVLAAAGFFGILIFAMFLRNQLSWLGTGWATGVCVVAFHYPD